MKGNFALGVVLSLGLGSAIVSAACSSSTTPAATDAGPTPTSTTEPDSGPPPAKLSLVPGDSDLATCRSVTFAATPSDGVTFSLEGEGKLEKARYDAPLKVPSPKASVIVTATRGDAKASSTLRLATALPSDAIDLPQPKAPGTRWFTRAVASNGARTYAVVGTQVAPFEVHLAKSEDGGVTFKADTSLVASHGGPATMGGASIAVDPVNPDLVHVLLRVDAGGPGYSTIASLGMEAAGSMLVLATSTDGGATFTQRTLYSGGNGDVLSVDVAAPSAGAVAVTASTTWLDSTTGAAGASVLSWFDGTSGTGLPALTKLDTGYSPNWSLGTELRLPNHVYTDVGDTGGLSLSADGKGHVCRLFTTYDIRGTVAPRVANVTCSIDGGKTFGTAVPAISQPIDTFEGGAIAMGKDGKLVVVVVHAKDSAVDSLGKTRYVVSVDGGATFGQPRDLPDVIGADNLRASVENEDVTVDDSGVIWFARTSGRGALRVDKSCDQGATLSGELVLSTKEATPSFVQPVLFQSSAGVFLSYRHAVSNAQVPSGNDLVLSARRLLAPR